MLVILLGSLCCAAVCGSLTLGVAPEPWPALNNASWTGATQPLSPDPLVSLQFNAGTNDTVLQIFPVAAVAIGPGPGTPASSFLNTSSAVGSTAVNIVVQGNGTLLIDFGVEMPAWIEFDSADLSPTDLGNIELAISEYTVVDYIGSFKSGSPVKVGSTCSSIGALSYYALFTSTAMAACALIGWRQIQSFMRVCATASFQFQRLLLCPSRF